MSHSGSVLRVFLAAAFISLLAVAGFADSHVRIVRLSQVEGTVQVDRDTGQGYEKAFPNLPITQGTKVHTGADGRAEIEFEDGSALRLAPNAVTEFPELSTRDSGAKHTTVKVSEGTSYLDFKGAKEEEFTLLFGLEKLVLTKPVHLRLQMGDTNSSLAVFKGKAQVEGPSGLVKVDGDEAVSFDFLNNNKATVAGNVEEQPFDTWDAQQQNYHKSYAASNSYSPYAYGMSDLNYYGNYFNAPGYGLLWQPYFTGVGWNPFMDGAWFSYPGFGYTWVSAYPWGWTPYRYGTWMSLPGHGWVWRPATSWSGWNTLPTVANAPKEFAPPTAPASGRAPVLIGRAPIASPAPSASHRIEINNDTAGLGIARGTVRNLGRVSQEVRTQGSASASVHPAPVGFWNTTSRPSTPTGGRASSGRSVGVGSVSAPASHAGSPHAGGAHK